MKMEMKLTGLDGVLDTLKSLPPEIVSRSGGPARAALRKGAKVILEQARANLTVSASNAPSYSTGLSAKSLRIARRKPPSGTKGEAARIFMKRVRYEGQRRRRGRAMTTDDAAWMLEYGTSQQPAEPWLRPAFNAKAEQAIRTVETELVKGIDRAVKKLAARNKGK